MKRVTLVAVSSIFLLLLVEQVGVAESVYALNSFPGLGVRAEKRVVNDFSKSEKEISFPRQSTLPQLVTSASYPTGLSIEEDSLSQLKIDPKTIAPNFEGETLDGKIVSLSDLKGKVVYLDVWATWCGPCRAEMPHSRKLMSLFGKEDRVAFVFISIDKNKAAWQKHLSREKISQGIQLLDADSNSKKSVSTLYQVDTIPRYILIDKTGKIIYYYAPPPSSSEIANEIEALLKE